MTRSELIDLMAEGQSQLSAKDVELAVKLLIDHMAETLSSGQRIEIRGFGSFSLHYREPRLGRIHAPVMRLICAVNTYRISNPARSCASA